MRNFGLISGLADKGHHVSLIAIDDTADASANMVPFTSKCKVLGTAKFRNRIISERIIDLLLGRADLTRRLFSPKIAGLLRETLRTEQFDIIHMDIQSYGYLSIIKKYAQNTKIIYDAHNAEYDLQKRIATQEWDKKGRLLIAVYSLLQARRLKNTETDLCNNAAHVFACSSEDARKLAELDHHTPITVIPNAISVEEYRETAINSVDIHHPAIVFTGKMDYKPNVDAATWLIDEIFPLVQEQFPRAHVYIVGQKPHPQLTQYTERPDITITGFVPDVKPYITHADVYTAPLRMGSGTRFKLLESMALKSPIVSTRIGAEGLGVSDGIHLLLADETEEVASAIIRVISDPLLAAEIAENGCQFVKEHFDWSVIIPLVESAYLRALSS